MTNLLNDNYDFSASFSPELINQLFSAIFSENKVLHEIKQDTVGSLQDTFISLMVRVREELLVKIDQLDKNTANYPHSKPVISMLLEKLTAFANDQQLPFHVDFFNRLLYRLELAGKLEKLNWSDHSIDIFSPVDELLIYMNYNSKTYLKLLESWLSKRIGEQSNFIRKIEHLNFYRKVFLQLPIKPETILYADYTAVNELINRWFEHEATYLESQRELFKASELEMAKEEMIKNRVKLGVSSDVFALFLRAGVDAEVLMESVNSACKKMVKVVATEHTDTLSAAAVRSRSYSSEQVDKDVAISKLQKMIRMIEGY